MGPKPSILMGGPSNARQPASGGLVASGARRPDFGRRCLARVWLPITLLVAAWTLIACGPAKLASPSPAPTSSATLLPPDNSPTAGRQISNPTATRDSGPALRHIADIQFQHLPGSGTWPDGMAILGDRLYVANLATSNVSVIQDDRVTAVIDVGKEPFALAADAARKRVYVASRGTQTITALDDDHPTTQWHVEGKPRSLAILGDYLYVGLDDRGAVLVYSLDDASLIAEIKLPGTVSVFSMVTGEDKIFAKGFGHIFRLDPATNQIEQSLVLTDTYASLALTTSYLLADLYDSTSSRSTLVALNPDDGTIVGQTVVDGDPRDIAVDQAAGRAYVVSQFARQVDVVALPAMTVTARIPVGLDPSSAVLDAQARRLYVANRESNSVSVINIDRNEVVGTIPLTVNPQGVSVDNERGIAYVTVPAMASVFAVSPQHVRQEIFTGGHPADIAVDERRRRAYVFDAAAGQGLVVDLDQGAIVRQVTLSPGASGVQLDTGRERVYLGDAILDANTGDIVGRLAVPTWYGNSVAPVAVVPAPERLYVLAPNGTPGSNYGLVITPFSGDPPVPIDARFGGLSTTALVWDAAGDLVYSTAFKINSAWLYVNEGASGKLRQRIDLSYYPSALALNGHTHHLVLGLSSMDRSDRQPENLLRVLDTRTMAVVFERAWAGSFGDMAFDTQRDWLYVTDPQRGLLSVWEDHAG